MTGPVQLLTIGLDEARVDPVVLAEFAKLQDANLIRVLDVLFLQHGHDGSIDTVDRLDAERMHHDGSLLTRLLTADPEGEEAANDAVWAVEDVVPIGGMVALVLVEHLWAAALVTAMAASGGRMHDEFWLTAEDRELLDSLLAGR